MAKTGVGGAGAGVAGSEGVGVGVAVVVIGAALHVARCRFKLLIEHNFFEQRSQTNVPCAFVEVVPLLLLLSPSSSNSSLSKICSGLVFVVVGGTAAAIMDAPEVIVVGAPEFPEDVE